MEKEQTELEQLSKKERFYSTIVNTALAGIVLGTVTCMSSSFYRISIQNTDLERMLNEKKSEIVQIEKSRDILSQYVNLSLTEIEDILQTKNKEIENIKSSVKYTEYINLENRKKDVRNLLGLSLGFTMFSLLNYAVFGRKYLKILDDFKETKDNERQRADNLIEQYIGFSEAFTLQGLKKHLENEKINCDLLNISLENKLKNYVEDERIDYHKETDLYERCED